MTALTFASVLFGVLALLSLVVITGRALEISVDFRATIAGRRAEQPAPAAEQPHSAPKLVHGTLRKARPDA